MIDIEVTVRPTRPSEWNRLLDAVFSATPADESYWLEWKSQYVWDRPSDLIKLSRAILGMANRDPSDASQYMEGVGIVLVGVEPGNAPGVEPIDPTDLENKLSPYLGLADGPRWQPHFVSWNGVVILIIEASAPRYGDPPFVLQHGGADFKKGQVFVRVGSATQPADQGLMGNLALRATPPATRPALELAVGVMGDTPLPTIYVDTTGLDHYLEARERELLAALDHSRGASSASAFGVMSSLYRPETRSVEEYREEVTSFIRDLADVLAAEVFSYGAVVGPSPVITVTNRSQKNYSKVHLSLTVEGEAHALDRVEEGIPLVDRLPQPPRAFGPYVDPLLNVGPWPYRSMPADYFPSPMAELSRREIRNGGSFVVDVAEFDLRPLATDVVVEDDVVFMMPMTRSGAVEVKWSATAANVDAVASGSFQLDFSAEPLDLVKMSGVRPGEVADPTE